MQPYNFKCSQCGAVNFTEENQKLRCNYCDSLFFIEVEKEKPTVIIKKGANVVFGGNVVVKGSIDIQEGAIVKFTGKLTLLKKASLQKIKEAKLRLMKEEIN